MSNVIKLSEARLGDYGVITQVGDRCHHAHDVELERRCWSWALSRARG